MNPEKKKTFKIFFYNNLKRTINHIHNHLLIIKTRLKKLRTQRQILINQCHFEWEEHKAKLIQDPPIRPFQNKIRQTYPKMENPEINRKAPPFNLENYHLNIRSNRQSQGISIQLYLQKEPPFWYI